MAEPKPTPTPRPPTMEEAFAMLDRHAAEEAAAQATPSPQAKKKAKAKDAIKEGARAARRGIVGTNTQSQLDKLNN